MARKKQKKPARAKSGRKPPRAPRKKAKGYYGGLTATAVAAIPRVLNGDADDPFSSNDPLGNWSDLTFT